MASDFDIYRCGHLAGKHAKSIGPKTYLNCWCGCPEFTLKEYDQILFYFDQVADMEKRTKQK